MQRKYVKDENYISIQGWMVTKLNLKQNELILFALIYGFSQVQGNAFNGSISYMCDWVEGSRSTVIRVLKSLEEKGLIKKQQCEIHNMKINEYVVNIPQIQNMIEASISDEDKENEKDLQDRLDDRGDKLPPGGCRCDNAKQKNDDSYRESKNLPQGGSSETIPVVSKRYQGYQNDTSSIKTIPVVSKRYRVYQNDDRSSTKTIPEGVSKRYRGYQNDTRGSIKTIPNNIYNNIDINKRERKVYIKREKIKGYRFSKKGSPPYSFSPTDPTSSRELTDSEYNRLVKEFGKALADRKSFRAKNYPGCYNYATIRKWCLEDAQKSPPSKLKIGFHNFEGREYDMDALTKKLIE